MSRHRDPQCGTLYVVPTPIGNLGDMVPRAVEVLQTVHTIAAEDTRHSRKLMQLFNIDKPMVSYHDHNETDKVQRIIEWLGEGKNIALISDAGTPLISDPGYRLVLEARQAGFRVVPIPGPCALVTALSASGLPSDRFLFGGFVPAKKSARVNLFESLVNEATTLIFYESPHRIVASLEDLVACFGEDRPVVFARELTKTFETFISCSAGELLSVVKEDPNQQRGEIVLLIKGCEPVSHVGEALSVEAQEMMKVMLGEKLPVKQAASITAKLTGFKKKQLYDWAVNQ